MVALVTAATFALGLASASGKLLSHSRYLSYYGGYDDGKFFENSVLQTGPDARSWATNPSYTRLNLVDSVDYPSVVREVETHIFAGSIRLPKCKAGVYKFRVTSDDDSTLLIDNQIVTSNPGMHGMISVEGTTTLHANHDIPFELWWGNAGGPAGLKLEYCYHHVATQRIKKQLGSIDASGEANKLLAEMDAEELDSFHCQMTTDLSPLLREHVTPTIRRCDYKGYFKDNLSHFSASHVSTKHLPTGCADESGGSIRGHDKPDWTMNSSDMSFSWEAKLMPRATGTHRFWATCNDACFLIISSTRHSTKLIALPGTHASQTRHGAIPLTQGEVYTMMFYYGNAGDYGEFKVEYQDPTMSYSAHDFTPLLV